MKLPPWRHLLLLYGTFFKIAALVVGGGLAMLPVIDNLERAIAAAESQESALVSGVQMTLRQMMETLTRMGLEEVPALGEKFDPDIHNAVMRAPEGEGEPGMVLEVFQKGYRVKGRMIRYAMVKIAAEN